MLKSRSMTALDGSKGYSSTRGLFASDGFDLFESLAAAATGPDESDFSGAVCSIRLSLTAEGYIAVETKLLRVRACWTVFKRREEFARLFHSLRVAFDAEVDIDRLSLELNKLANSEIIFSSVTLQQFLDNQYSTLSQEITIRTLQKQAAAVKTQREEPAFGIGLADDADQDADGDHGHEHEHPARTQEQEEDVALTADEVLLVLRNAEEGSFVGRIYAHCEERLSALQPSGDAFHVRNEASGKVKSVLKAALGAPAHAIGSVPLGTFLKNDANVLSVFVNAAQEKLWFTSVAEFFCRLATLPADGRKSAEGIAEVESVLAEMKLDGEEDSVRRWAQGIKEVKFVPASRTVVCEVAGMRVEIHANRIDELCKLGLFEQIDRTLGANHVFKRTLLMVKSFIRRQDASLLDELSEYVVFVLVTSVFSVFSSRISNPLQAFALFCAFFHKLDWANYVVGVFQVCRTEDFSPESRPAHTPFQSYIATVVSQYAEKYQRSMHRRRVKANGLEHPPDVGVEEADGLVYLPSSLQRFTLASMNIQDPLDPDANLAWEIPHVVLERFRNVLRKGAFLIRGVVDVLSAVEGNQREAYARVDDVLRAVQGDIDASTLEDPSEQWESALASAYEASQQSDIRRISSFPATFQRSMARDSVLSLESLDIFEGAAARLGLGDACTLNLDALDSSLLYCSLLLESEVTAPALLALAREILKEKGPLPVGEIGKSLQESTSNPQIPSILKEKFGGLKKFLEVNKESFLISNDHPYNPKVYLIDTLTNSQIQDIMHGIAPRNTTAQGHTPKKRKGKQKKSKHHSRDQPASSGMRSAVSMVDLSRMANTGFSPNVKEFVPGQWGGGRL